MGNSLETILNEKAQEQLANLAERLSKGRPARKHLPPGRGQYSVGCADLMTDRFSHNIFFRLYYPTAKTDIEQQQMQWPLWLPSKKYGKGYAYFRRKNTKIYGSILNWLGGDMYVPALWLAPIVKSDEKFPVIVFSHGLGGNRTTYSTMCCDVASHGYIVAALEHRDGSASMTFRNREAEMGPLLKTSYLALNRQYGLSEEWTPYERPHISLELDFRLRNPQVHKRGVECVRCLDILQCLNDGNHVYNVLPLNFDLLQFQGRIDMDRAAVMGHSFGGGTTVCALSKDQRFRVGVCLDSWMLPLERELYDKVLQPVLFVNTETFQWPSNVNDMLRLDPTAADRPMITVMGSCHQSMSDFQFLVSSVAGKLLSFRHALESQVCMDIINDASLAFLRKHLDIPRKVNAGRVHPGDEILAGHHSSVILGTHLDLSTNYNKWA